MTPWTISVHEKSEPELVGDARIGDSDAMAELFRRHYPHSITVARRLLPAQGEFLDAVQSAYLSAFRNFQSFRGEASFKTWITRIVVNHCLMRLREPRRRQIVVSLDHPGVNGVRPTIAGNLPTPEDLALRAELNRVIADAAARLPKRLSDVFIRCGISGLSVQDTAEALGLTVQATKTRLFRARGLMRQRLHTEFGATSHRSR
jgi:RNA polymerase sigma-70 factor (ECF subfamily)